MMAVSVDFEVDLEQIAIENTRCLGYDGLKEKQLESLYLFSKAMTLLLPYQPVMASHLFMQPCHIRLTG